MTFGILFSLSMSQDGSNDTLFTMNDEELWNWPQRQYFTKGYSQWIFHPELIEETVVEVGDEAVDDQLVVVGEVVVKVHVGSGSTFPNWL